MASLRDWNHFLRPNIWLFVLAVYAIAFLATDMPLAAVHAAGVAVFVMLCTASITINHYFDYETDRKSKQLHRFPVAAGRIGRRFALGFSTMLMMSSLLLASFFLSVAASAITLFANFMIVAYSAPPLRIKEIPYLETVWNGAGYGTVPYYLALAIGNVQLSLNLHLLGLIPFFVAASGHVLLQVRDIGDDTSSRVITTATKLGPKRMVKASKLFVLAAGAVVIYLIYARFLSAFALLALAAGAFVVVKHRRMKKDVTRSYRRLQLAYLAGGLAFLLSLA